MTLVLWTIIRDEGSDDVFVTAVLTGGASSGRTHNQKDDNRGDRFSKNSTNEVDDLFPDMFLYKAFEIFTAAADTKSDLMTNKDLFETLPMPNTARIENQLDSFSFVVTALKNCGMNKVSIFSADTCSVVSDVDDVSKISRHSDTQCLPRVAVRNLLQTFETFSIPVQYFQIQLTAEGIFKEREHLREILWTSYYVHQVRYFVCVSEKPWEIMTVAEEIFQREHRGYGALMPHSIRFVLVGLSKQKPTAPLSMADLEWISEMSELSTPLLTRPVPVRSPMISDMEAHLKTSKFDNVLLLPYTQNTSCDPCFKLENPFSLMWRENRTREFEIVANWRDVNKCNRYTKTQAKENSRKKCAMFPNVSYNLNGRHLIVLAKVWPPYLTAVKANDDNCSRYGGFLADVIEGLSQVMNFSYTLTPDPHSSLNFSLRELEVKLGTKLEADFMARLYYVTSFMVYNQSVTHPIVMANMSGAYFLRPSNALWSTFNILESNVFACLGFKLALFIFFYCSLSLLQSQLPTTPGANEEKLDSSHPVRCELNSKQPRHKNSVTTRSSNNCVSFSNYHHGSNMESMQTAQQQPQPDGANKSFMCGKLNWDVDTPRTTRLLNVNLPFQGTEGTNVLRSNPSSKLKHFRDYIISQRRRYHLAQQHKIWPKIGHLSVDFPGNPNPSKSLFHVESSFDGMNQPEKQATSVANKLCSPEGKRNKNVSNAPKNSFRQKLFGLGLYRLKIEHLCITMNSALCAIVDFSGTLFGQGNIPAQRFFSGRVLIFFWGLTIVILIGTLRGNLASMLVSTSTTKPFQRFADVQARHDYRWGHYNSSFLPILEEAKEPPLGPLYAGMKRFLEEDPEILTQTQEQLIAKAAKEKFVAIIDSFFLDMIIREKGYSLVQVIPEILGTTGLGLNLPPHSELTDLMSENIITMVDKGLIDFYLKKTYQQLCNNATPINMSPKPDTAMKKTLQLCRLCAPFLSTAAIVLLFEITVLRYWRRDIR
ncbi:hypothetical protein RRG08_003179 [Elysia crispata]|uniref:Ionotropic glutamate receptor C-terminal domain-containing protein n=1 Tax=Elysia crispata TaxID=231223 RepID=A0AAE1EBP9_9GAST|nr:hypothetical protein RRG08_003179 [Elysia crispata]